ncbi:hypothetical protein [Thiocystis violascens]|uniref:hypothetical protein n=1 Tax=Thiocystis violascens TaxID=73141 RepID=UPI00145E57BD|nr:hypothetical protein [Thiocystis violascens]
MWLEAHIHQLDSHVLWSAKLNTRVENNDEIRSKWLFNNYFCDSEILHEFIKRGIVANVTKDVKKHITEHAWNELSEVIDCCKPYISIPLNEETENHYKKYRTLNEIMWFEIVVEQFSEALVQFSLSLFGYKYILKNLELNKQEFYEFADRLEGKIRFNNDWFPLDAMRNKLLSVSNKGALSCISRDLAHELELLKKPTSRQVVSSCRAIFPLLERTLREHVGKKEWKGRADNMDLLVNMHEKNGSAPIYRI